MYSKQREQLLDIRMWLYCTKNCRLHVRAFGAGKVKPSSIAAVVKGFVMQITDNYFNVEFLSEEILKLKISGKEI